MADIENTIIIGSGPAGYTAALYTARANLAPLVIEGFAWGGLLQQTTDVENYPGFPEGMMGPELMGKMRAQAERFGARLETDQAERVLLASEPGGVHSVWVGDTEHRARTVILAMGAEHKRLGVARRAGAGRQGRELLRHLRRGLLQGRADDDRRRGDSAMEEAIFLSKFASKVAVVHRRPEWRASKIMLERARAQENIEFLTPYTIKAFLPGESGALDRALLFDVGSGRGARARDLAAPSSRSGTSPSRSWCAGRWRWTRTGMCSPRVAPPSPTAPACSPRGISSTTPTARRSPPPGRAARRRSTRSGICATPRRCPRPRGSRSGTSPKRQWAAPATVQTAGGE